MHSILPHQAFDAVYVTPSRRISRRGSAAPFEEALVVEHNMLVSINQVESFEIVCTPTDLEDLVLGRLLSEGVIQTLEQVELLYICQDGLRADVLLRDGTPQPRQSAVVARVNSCCTGNRTLALAPEGRGLAPLKPMEVPRDWIFTLAAELKQDMPIYEATHGTHSALLMRGGAVLTRAEDIGRHNALDKVLGWALRNGVPLEECVVYTSGRIPVDMVEKTIRARVPVFVSKAMPTQQAVELAEQYGLTLIAGARADSMIVFSKEEPHAAQ